MRSSSDLHKLIARASRRTCAAITSAPELWRFFAGLGLVAAVRNAGLPADFPNDIAFRTTATGIEIGRISIPCRAKRYTKKDGPDGWWPTPEPPHRINQIYLEPVMFAYAAAMKRLRILSRTSVADFEQRADGVLATANDLDTGATRQILARYLVGCDGARQAQDRRDAEGRQPTGRGGTDVSASHDAGAGLGDRFHQPAMLWLDVRNRWAREMARPPFPATGRTCVRRRPRSPRARR
jgi:2-polyprenyl-6-methoxyphenol hydroxylase-like FAD-dependent oxidoreductase